MQSVSNPPAAISPDQVYPLTTFSALTGLKRHAIRTARRQGLRVLEAGGRRFVCGADFVEYLNRINSQNGEPKE